MIVILFLEGGAYTWCWSSIHHSCFSEVLTKNQYYHKTLQRSRCGFFSETSFYHSRETASSSRRGETDYELHCLQSSNTSRGTYRTRKACCLSGHITASRVQSEPLLLLGNQWRMQVSLHMTELWNRKCPPARNVTTHVFKAQWSRSLANSDGKYLVSQAAGSLGLEPAPIK